MARISSEVRDVTYQLDELHRNIQEMENWLAHLEDEAESANLPRVRYALRDTVQKLIKASQALVEAHLTLNIPAVAYQRHP